MAGGAAMCSGLSSRVGVTAVHPAACYKWKNEGLLHTHIPTHEPIVQPCTHMYYVFCFCFFFPVHPSHSSLTKASPHGSLWPHTITKSLLNNTALLGRSYNSAAIHMAAGECRSRKVRSAAARDQQWVLMHELH